MTTFKRTVDQLVKMGVKAVCLLPLTEMASNTASPFSRSSNNALSTRLIDLAEVPEIAENDLLRTRLGRTLDNAASVLAGPRVNNAMVETRHAEYLKAAYKGFAVVPTGT